MRSISRKISPDPWAAVKSMALQNASLPLGSATRCTPSRTHRPLRQACDQGAARLSSRSRGRGQQVDLRSSVLPGAVVLSLGVRSRRSRRCLKYTAPCVGHLIVRPYGRSAIRSHSARALSPSARSFGKPVITQASNRRRAPARSRWLRSSESRALTSRAPRAYPQLRFAHRTLRRAGYVLP